MNKITRPVRPNTARTEAAEHRLLGALETLLFALEDLDDALSGRARFGAAYAVGLVMRHGLAFVAEARALAEHGGSYRVALVRDDDTTILGDSFTIDLELAAEGRLPATFQ